MGAGKYSPTVFTAYSKNQDWHRNLCDENDWIDRDGYDSYGYHVDTEKDRAGYTEWDYLSSGQWIGDDYEYVLVDQVARDWGFDGIRPVKL